MDYTESIGWFASWPILICLSVWFVRYNLTHFSKLEKHEAYEKKYEKEIDL